MPRKLMAGVGGLFLVAFMAATATAYSDTVVSTVECIAPTTVVNGATATVKALVQGTENGTTGPIADKLVTWSYSPSSADVTLNPKTSVTDANGIAETKVIVKSGTNVTIRATVDDAFCTSNIKVRKSGLPNTSVEEPQLGWLAFVVVAFAAIATLVGLRRRAGSRA